MPKRGENIIWAVASAATTYPYSDIVTDRSTYVITITVYAYKLWHLHCMHHIRVLRHCHRTVNLHNHYSIWLQAATTYSYSDTVTDRSTWVGRNHHYSLIFRKPVTFYPYSDIVTDRPTWVGRYHLYSLNGILAVASVSIKYSYLDIVTVRSTCIIIIVFASKLPPHTRTQTSSQTGQPA